jgi:hypothetical protein
MSALAWEMARCQAYSILRRFPGVPTNACQIDQSVRPVQIPNGRTLGFCRPRIPFHPGVAKLLSWR